ncbi:MULTISPECIES: transposase [unclassified Nodosilinea]|uniref:Transposase n=1 Tax=Leptolyngbya subtilissima DQ-A4 TaxID=2933933 RepID=A0ABV0K8L7_9CYAN|nr:MULTISPECIES: transposase [unclassified Nodosilinea]MBD2105952.1 transposase [Nodosilinea sp. FACHB-13]MBD2110559.1 transposase [Nodosilinea sp. FACHB-141]
MAQQHPCPHCNNRHLLRIGVRGIRQCSSCKAYVDVRSRHWLKRLIRDRAA